MWSDQWTCFDLFTVTGGYHNWEKCHVHSIHVINLNGRFLCAFIGCTRECIWQSPSYSFTCRIHLINISIGISWNLWKKHSISNWSPCFPVLMITMGPMRITQVTSHSKNTRINSKIRKKNNAFIREYKERVLLNDFYWMSWDTFILIPQFWICGTILLPIFNQWKSFGVKKKNNNYKLSYSIFVLLQIDTSISTILHTKIPSNYANDPHTNWNARMFVFIYFDRSSTFTLP